VPINAGFYGASEEARRVKLYLSGVVCGKSLSEQADVR
jgi:hypothetical protein